jgi:hypothetical protein
MGPDKGDAQPKEDSMAAYDITGSLLEACSCGAPCPCWIGEDPHGGKCDAFLAYRIDRGSIGGVDCSGVTFAIVALVPGNILKGNWKIAVYVSDAAKPDQKQAVLDAWTGKLGGPLADLAKLIGEVKGVHDARIDFRLEKGKGILKVGDKVDAEMAPYTDGQGNPTTMSNTIFTTIPGSPAYVAKATHHRVNIPEYGMKWTFENRNAVQGSFHFAA